MSWAEIKKSINSDLDVPLNELIVSSDGLGAIDENSEYVYKPYSNYQGDTFVKGTHTLENKTGNIVELNGSFIIYEIDVSASITATFTDYYYSKSYGTILSSNCELFMVIDDKIYELVSLSRTIKTPIYCNKFFAVYSNANFNYSCAGAYTYTAYLRHEVIINMQYKPIS